MNCEELIRKMNNKDNDTEMLNELIFENESNTLEILNQTEAFFKINEKVSGGIEFTDKTSTELLQ